MVWKNGKTGFHGVELFREVASMVWKNAENGFHGVEAAKWRRMTTGGEPRTPGEGRGSDDGLSGGRQEGEG